MNRLKKSGKQDKKLLGGTKTKRRVLKMNNIVTYEPDNSLKKGYFSMFGEILHELKNNKWLTFQLFKRDFFAVYKQSFVGIFWAFIMPLVSIGTFFILNRSGVLDVGEIDIPYPIYALLGMAFWQVFSTGLGASSNSLGSAVLMITKINFSKKSLIFASMGRPVIIFLFQLVFVAILFVIYKIMPNKDAFLAPLVLVPILFLVMGLGFILALFNSFIKDVGNGFSVLITFLMFLTPVLYAKPKMGILTHITRYNPMYYMMSAGRDLVLTGTISELKGFILSSIASILIFIVSLLLFHLTETRITERI